MEELRLHLSDVEFSVILPPQSDADSFALQHAYVQTDDAWAWVLEWRGGYYQASNLRRMRRMLEENARDLMTGAVLINKPFLRNRDTDIRATELMVRLESRRREGVHLQEQRRNISD